MFGRRLGRGRVPTLSVVVPVFDVAPYLSASLDSILRQQIDDLEVILVNDGSTDASTEILRAYAAAHPQLTLIEQENAGVSVARNVGVARARGEFLTFADPDDLVPAGSWARMLEVIRRTGSDFVVGSTERLTATPTGERQLVLPLMARNHRAERLGIRIEDQPLMLADVFVWNKLFRRTWWMEQGLSFPEGVNYEDQVALTEAFLAADAFDVLTDVVYHWRVRADGSSATQRRARLGDLGDRMVTKQMTRGLVESRGSDELLGTLMTQVLPVDMWEHFRAAVSPATPQPNTYWETLRGELLRLWNEDTVPFHHTDLSDRRRLMGWLVAQDRRTDLARLIAHIDAPVIPQQRDRRLHLPGVPEELLYA